MPGAKRKLQPATDTTCQWCSAGGNGERVHHQLEISRARRHLWLVGGSGREALLLAAALALALGVCGSAPHHVDWQREALPRPEIPGAYQRLLVREVTTTAAATSAEEPGERLEIERELWRAHLISVLRESGIVRQVAPYEEGPAPPRSDPTPTRMRIRLEGGVAARTFHEDGIPNPEAARPGLVLDVAFRDAKLLATGENSEADRAFWLWISAGPAGLFVRDHTFELSYAASLRVSDAETGDVVIPWIEVAPLSSHTYALNFHERTAGPLPYLAANLIPPGTLGSDGAQVLKEVFPESFRGGVRALAALLARLEFPTVNRFELEPKEVAGVRVEEILAPIGIDVVGNTIDLTLIVTIGGGAERLSGQVRVSGRTLDDPDAVRPLATDRAEVRLERLTVLEGEPVPVAILMDGEPKTILRVRAVPTGHKRPRLVAAATAGPKSESGGE